MKAALTIAGSDSGGGAGIQADLKTFAAFGVYGTSVVTAVTAQNTREVRAIHPVPPHIIAAQIDAVLGDVDVSAIKIGMLGGVDAIEAVVAGLDQHAGRPLVLDPVMIATTGARLLAEDALDALISLLIPRASLVTPNLIEAAALLGEPVADDQVSMARQGRDILRMGAAAVLVKGGHAAGPESVDILVQDGLTTRFSRPRVRVTRTHGTGCTLSSAIAAGIALGRPLSDAVSAAKLHVTERLANHDDQGHGV